jgi:hypothetical protein
MKKCLKYFEAKLKLNNNPLNPFEEFEILKFKSIYDLHFNYSLFCFIL